MNYEKLLADISDIIDKKFDEKFDQKFDEKFDQKLAPINQRLDSFDEKFDRLDQKFDEKLAPIYNRLDRLESETSALRAGQRDIRKDLREINAKVNETYDIALDAFGTSMENRTWLEKSNIPI